MHVLLLLDERELSFLYWSFSYEICFNKLCNYFFCRENILNWFFFLFLRVGEFSNHKFIIFLFCITAFRMFCIFWIECNQATVFPLYKHPRAVRYHKKYSSPALEKPYAYCFFNPMSSKERSHKIYPKEQGTDVFH